MDKKVAVKRLVMDANGHVSVGYVDAATGAALPNLDGYEVHSSWDNIYDGTADHGDKTTAEEVKQGAVAPSDNKEVIQHNGSDGSNDNVDYAAAVTSGKTNNNTGYFPDRPAAPATPSAPAPTQTQAPAPSNDNSTVASGIVESTKGSRPSSADERAQERSTPTQSRNSNVPDDVQPAHNVEHRDTFGPQSHRPNEPAQSIRDAFDATMRSVQENHPGVTLGYDVTSAGHNPDSKDPTNQSGRHAGLPGESKAIDVSITKDGTFVGYMEDPSLYNEIAQTFTAMNPSLAGVGVYNTPTTKNMHVDITGKKGRWAWDVPAETAKTFYSAVDEGRKGILPGITYSNIEAPTPEINPMVSVATPNTVTTNFPGRPNLQGVIPSMPSVGQPIGNQVVSKAFTDRLGPLGVTTPATALQGITQDFAATSRAPMEALAQSLVGQNINQAVASMGALGLAQKGYSTALSNLSAQQLDQITKAAVTELSPATLQGVGKKDPAALNTLAGFMSVMGNRLDDQRYANVEDKVAAAVTPSQFNGLANPNLDENYSAYGVATKDAIQGIISGQIDANPVGTSTNFFSGAIKDLDPTGQAWASQLTGLTPLGQTTFGTLAQDWSLSPKAISFQKDLAAEITRTNINQAVNAGFAAPNYSNVQAPSMGLTGKTSRQQSVVDSINNQTANSFSTPDYGNVGSFSASLSAPSNSMNSPTAGRGEVEAGTGRSSFGGFDNYGGGGDVEAGTGNRSYGGYSGIDSSAGYGFDGSGSSGGSSHSGYGGGETEAGTGNTSRGGGDAGYGGGGFGAGSGSNSNGGYGNSGLGGGSGVGGSYGGGGHQDGPGSGGLGTSSGNYGGGGFGHSSRGETEAGTGNTSSSASEASGAAHGGQSSAGTGGAGGTNEGGLGGWGGW